MKKVKRSFLALVLVFAMLLTMVPSFAAEATENEKVEIAFKLGDNILTINGNPVEVQTPYAVGVGVTLVPVRVITEAFGAKVGWDGTNQTIPIEYGGVNILLQIGNPIAEVNGTPETLLAPPEISGQSTMVPLRFISETFGAVVGYDNETGRVTVTKETGEEGTTVEGRVDSLRIGDSYYGWSIDNPSDYTIDRGFDGSYTYFEYDEDNWIAVCVDAVDEDYSFDEDFSNIKSEASQYTMVAAEKYTDDPTVKKAYVKYKDKIETCEEYIYVSNGYRYNVYMIFANELKEELAEASRILSTFKLYFTKEDTHDLSTVKDGFRNYASDSMNLSLNIPVGFSIFSNEDVENDIYFASTDEKDYFSSIHLTVYSKSEVGSAKEMSEKDYTSNKGSYNEEITRISTPEEVKYSGFTGYSYTIKVSGESISATITDTFFEVGDYTYNISVGLDRKIHSDSEKLTKSILNSIKANPIDSEETGILMRYEPDRKATYTIKGDEWSVTVPESYEKQISGDKSVVLSDVYTGTTISISIKETTGSNRNSDLVESLKDFEESIRKDPKNKILFATGKTTTGAYTYNGFSFKTSKKNAMTVYSAIYTALRGKKEITIIVVIPEVAHSIQTKQIYLDILGSLVVEP